jgi:hypothetical protein
MFVADIGSKSIMDWYIKWVLFDGGADTSVP